MKHIFLFLIITVLLTSCNKKTVLLPETSSQDITEILDVSPVYLFYDKTRPDSTDFNRKNMISTTNWLVNIDKRLTLKQIFPHLQYLQEKRNKDGMHKNENAKNYFTCSNPEIQNLAFIEFTNVVYQLGSLDSSSQKINNSQDVDDNGFSIIFNSNSTFGSNGKNHNIKNLASFISKISLEETAPDGLYLFFHEGLSFQSYISIKSTLLKLDLGKVVIKKEEFIYN